MAQSGEAITPFLIESLQPFEEALNLRRKTPSPKPDCPESPSIYHPGMSTRELQALYRKSTAITSPPRSSGGADSRDSSSASFENHSASTDEELQSPAPVWAERPLDTIRRQSASYDSLPVLKAPRRTTGPDTDPVFGLDIRDAFGWRFEESTPYDVLLPAPPITSRPNSFALQPRRSSTPSLSSGSSPATSSATTSTVSSITTPGATYTAENGMSKRRVSSMGDVPSLASVPSPQPIPLGKSRMNNELHYESSPEVSRRIFSTFFSRAAGKHKNVVKNPSLPAAIRKASDPDAKPDLIKSRSALSLPKIGKQKASMPMSPAAIPGKLASDQPSSGSAPQAKSTGPSGSSSRARPDFSVGPVLARPKPATTPQGPRSVSLPGIAAEDRMAPALPMATAMSQTSLLISEGSPNPRLSKRQSEDLLYKKRSDTSLRSNVAHQDSATHNVPQGSQTEKSHPTAPPTSPTRGPSQRFRSTSAH